jgi:hypothetical protein
VPIAGNAAAAVAVDDHAQRQQRVGDAPLEGDEGEQDGAANQGADGDEIAPAAGLAAG